MARQLAVAGLQNFFDTCHVNVPDNVNLDYLWQSMVAANDKSLKSGWIINCSQEVVRFYVYNCCNPCKCLFWEQLVHAQPGEKVEVHGWCILPCENLVVYRDNYRDTYSLQREEEAATPLDWRSHDSTRI